MELIQLSDDGTVGHCVFVISQYMPNETAYLSSVSAHFAGLHRHLVKLPEDIHLYSISSKYLYLLLPSFRALTD
jgi:hypothetical protein